MIDLDDDMLYFVWGSEYSDECVDTIQIIECSDCKGNGSYILFNLIHKCKECEGTGKKKKEFL